MFVRIDFIRTTRLNFPGKLRTILKQINANNFAEHHLEISLIDVPSQTYLSSSKVIYHYVLVKSANFELHEVGVSNFQLPSCLKELIF